LCDFGLEIIADVESGWAGGVVVSGGRGVIALLIGLRVSSWTTNFVSMIFVYYWDLEMSN
jgi:hypothetical protein